MHVYFREEPVQLEMRKVDAEGLVETETAEELIPVAFFVLGNERPSFRALLPPETVKVLDEAMQEPVQLGLLAEEPEEPGAEVRAMVGVTLSVEGLPEGAVEEEDDEDEADGEGPAAEPWAANPDAWKGAADDEDEEGSRTVMLAFAPLVRLARRFPLDFAEELADLLESALSGNTKPNLEARIDRMLGDL